MRTLWGVHEDLRAYLFLFIEIASVGNCATGCRHLRDCLWTDAMFWRAYGGPCLLQEPLSTPAPTLRNGFRRWLFHLDGNWTEDFQAFVDEAHASEFGADFTQLLSDAKYVASGLMPGDDEPSVAAFARILHGLLAGYSPSQVDERTAAEALVLRVERRNDVFSEEQVQMVSQVYDQSVERAILDRNIEDAGSEPDLLPDLLEEEEEDEDWNRFGGPLGGALPFGEGLDDMS